MRGHTGHGVTVRQRPTIVCFIMADNSFALFPVAELLLSLGARPGKTRNTFHSPFREDKNASRRVVFKFRMTDEQMIQQLKDILEDEP